MAILGFHHVGLSTSDLDRSVAFYCKLFGFEKVFDFEWKAGAESIDKMMALRGTAARVAMLRTGTYGRYPDGNVIEILEICDPCHPLNFANRRFGASREGS